MNYSEKLADVLFTAAMATEEDLEHLHKMTLSIVPDVSVGKQQADRADLCRGSPDLDANDTELLVASARTMRRGQ